MTSSTPMKIPTTSNCFVIENGFGSANAGRSNGGFAFGAPATFGNNRFGQVGASDVKPFNVDLLSISVDASISFASIANNVDAKYRPGDYGPMSMLAAKPNLKDDPNQMPAADTKVGVNDIDESKGSVLLEINGNQEVPVATSQYFNPVKPEDAN